MENLGVDNEYFSLWNANFSVTQLIGVSVPKPGIERVVIWREKRFDILQYKKECFQYSNWEKRKMSPKLNYKMKLPLNRQSWIHEELFLSLPYTNYTIIKMKNKDGFYGKYPSRKNRYYLLCIVKETNHRVKSQQVHLEECFHPARIQAMFAPRAISFRSLIAEATYTDQYWQKIISNQ